MIEMNLERDVINGLDSSHRVRLVPHGVLPSRHRHKRGGYLIGRAPASNMVERLRDIRGMHRESLTIDQIVRQKERPCQAVIAGRPTHGQTRDGGAGCVESHQTLEQEIGQNSIGDGGRPCISWISGPGARHSQTNRERIDARINRVGSRSGCRRGLASNSVTAVESWSLGATRTNEQHDNTDQSNEATTHKQPSAECGDYGGRKGPIS